MERLLFKFIDALAAEMKTVDIHDRHKAESVMAGLKDTPDYLQAEARTEELWDLLTADASDRTKCLMINFDSSINRRTYLETEHYYRQGIEDFKNRLITILLREVKLS